MLLKHYLTVGLLLFLVFEIYGQGGNHKYTHKKLTEYTDSLKNTPYPFILPFLGKKAQKKGFDIQRPFGVMTNITSGAQEMNINRLSVSADNIEYHDVTDLVNFTKVRPQISVINARPDVWILPFLNVSGLIGHFNSTTDVWLDQPAEMKFVAHNKGTVAGFGAMATGGIGPIFISYEYNGTWSFTEKLFNSTYTQLNGIRIGHQHKNHYKPQSAWNLWIGAEAMHLSPLSRGAVNLSDVADMTPEEMQNASAQLDTWYNNLSRPEQLLLEPVYNKVSNWLNNGEDEILYYDFDKVVKQKWNLLTGFLYQFNKNTMISAETSYMGSRWRLVASFQYRFGI